MYSTYNEGNSVIVEKFIRTLKNEVYRRPVQALNNTTLTAEKCIRSILLQLKRNFVYSCIIMEQIVIC